MSQEVQERLDSDASDSRRRALSHHFMALVRLSGSVGYGGPLHLDLLEKSGFFSSFGVRF